jgi:hypothetical protein
MSRLSLLLVFMMIAGRRISWSQEWVPIAIPQESPQLCGKAPGVVLPLPNGITVNVDKDEAILDLPVSGSTKRIHLPGVTSFVEQVCPVSGHRLVVFGSAYQAMNISILDSTSGVLLDHIDAVHPTMSPDQRWIAFETFYPEHSELPVSSEYRLYDLHKSAAQNRADGVSPQESIYVGRVVFPLVEGRGDSEKRHQAQLESFTWSQEGHAFAFVDTVGNDTSLIVVKISGDGRTTPYVSRLTGAQLCESIDARQEQSLWNNLKVEIGSSETPSIQLSVQGDRRCTPKLTSLAFQDLLPAKQERNRGKKKTSILVQ